MKKVLWLLLFSIALFGLDSCASLGSQADEQLPGVDLPMKAFNQKIVLQDTPQAQNSYELGSIYVLVLRNKSSEEIIFPSDVGLKIFTKSGDQWSEVENRMTYPDLEMILPTDYKLPGGIVTDFSPYISGLDASTKIRVIVVGRVKDQPDELVGAYIDLPLKP
jgi:hypothetical protein